MFYGVSEVIGKNHESERNNNKQFAELPESVLDNLRKCCILVI